MKASDLFGREIESLENALLMLALAIHGFVPADQIVRGAAREILDGLHIVLAEGNKHFGRHAFDLAHFVGNDIYKSTVSLIS